MLARHIFSYLPSLIIPALVAFASIFCFTRLLSPEQFGHYALTLNMTTIIVAVFYYWLQTSLPRLMPQAIKEERVAELHATTYVLYLCISLTVAILGFLYISIAPRGTLLDILPYAIALAVLRALININQTFHRCYLNIKRYNIIECGQSVIGFVVGITLVGAFGWGGSGALCGMLIGMACVALIDIRPVFSIRSRYFQRDMTAGIIRFGFPLFFGYGFALVISVSDRFFIEYYHGIGQVGIYSAGYSLMDRINQLVFMIVAVPSFPLTVRKLELEGVEAAREQTYHNAIALLSLALPATTGLIMLSAPLAALLIGAEFREGALQVMPWIASIALLSGLSTHYFDHAYHLGKQTYKLLYSLMPAAALNLLLNFLLIPKYGNQGAVWATGASYCTLLAINIIVGRGVFAIRFPFKAAGQIIAACALMALVLAVIPFPTGFIGLIGSVITGGAVYVSAIFILNVEDVRQKLQQVVKKIRA